VDYTFVGPFEEEERSRIARTLRALGGCGRMISLPRWTVFSKRVGSRPFYMVVDNRNNRSCHGDSVDELIRALRASGDASALSFGKPWG
jgi:hypothetical protein